MTNPCVFGVPLQAVLPALLMTSPWELCLAYRTLSRASEPIPVLVKIFPPSIYLKVNLQSVHSCLLGLFPYVHNSPGWIKPKARSPWGNSTQDSPWQGWGPRNLSHPRCPPGCAWQEAGGGGGEPGLEAGHCNRGLDH